MKFESFDQLITKDDVKLFYAAHPLSKISLFNGTSLIVATVLFIFGIIYFISALNSDSGLTTTFFIFVVIAIVAPLAIYHVGRMNYKRAVVGIRTERMAIANGWNYESRFKDARYEALLFNAGRDYIFSNVVKSEDFEAGQFEYTTGSGRSQQTHYYAYMVVPLERNMPHMVLDGMSNNVKLFGMSMSNLPASFNKDQVVSLEGDFDKYYTLYAPTDYGIDVRYIFTPDLMGALVDESDSIDAEILDDNMFIYFGKNNLGDRVFWQKVDRLYDILENKLVKKTDRYKDDRTVDGTVAVQGMRLKKGVSAFTIVVIVFFIVYYGFTIMGANR